MDLFFMDFNGVWLDEASTGQWDGNAVSGAFDRHIALGPLAIWVSRIIGSSAPGLGKDASITNAYFSKVHKRMIGNDNANNRMLILGNNVGGTVQNGWPDCEIWAGAGTLGYENTQQHLRSQLQDTRMNWLNGLVDGYEYAAIFEHSSPVLHATATTDYLHSDYLGTKTNTRYYNLFACSNARYTVKDFLGGLYGWGHNGLVSVGSTKSGSMLGFESYNGPLGNNQSFGESFKKWYNDVVFTNNFPDIYKISWHYGMVLLGAGTLKLKQITPAPTNVTATGSTSKITVNWRSVTNAAYYYIKRSSSNTGTPAVIGNVAAPATSFNDLSVTPGVTYYYTVSALRTGMTESPNSSPIVAASAAAPACPTVRMECESFSSLSGYTALSNGTSGISSSQFSKSNGKYSGGSGIRAGKHTFTNQSCTYKVTIRWYDKSTSVKNSYYRIVIKNGSTVVLDQKWYANAKSTGWYNKTFNNIPVNNGATVELYGERASSNDPVIMDYVEFSGIAQ
jgi:hypothetical protein